MVAVVVVLVVVDSNSTSEVVVVVYIIYHYHANRKWNYLEVEGLRWDLSAPMIISAM